MTHGGYGHNDWAHTLRLIFALVWGKDYSKWPPIAGEIIYSLAEKLEELYSDGAMPK